MRIPKTYKIKALYISICVLILEGRWSRRKSILLSVEAFVPLTRTGITRTKLAEKGPSSWDKFNPYNAGKLFRDFIEEKTKREDKRGFYLDERFTDFEDGAPLYASESLPSMEDEDLMPEVLVVGATGQLGRIIVRKLLLEGYKVRVLVRDLYSSTLNLLGPKVIYCKGDLLNYDSLEFAVTGIDKIIFCAADELINYENNNSTSSQNEKKNLDTTGLSNLIQSFLNTRVADYGNSQSAKRKLFKFSRDFDLFSLEQNTTVADSEISGSNYLIDSYSEQIFDNQERYDDYNSDYVETNSNSFQSNNLAANWIINNRNRAVFYGRIPISDQRYRASIISKKLESKTEDHLNFDRAGFAGFIMRVVGDGKTYEAIVRTSRGEEYFCPFDTATKPQNNETLVAVSGASSIPKFSTVRLPFRNFMKSSADSTNDEVDGNEFDGSDVQYFGVRFQTSANDLQNLPQSNKFYLALAYVKLYRKPMLSGPEVVYISDASIPPKITPEMVRDDVKQIITTSNDDLGSSKGGFELFNERREKLSTRKSIERGRRLGTTETYFKYIGEQLVKNSGLNYAVLRITGYNNAPGSDGASLIELDQKNENDNEEESNDNDRLQLVSRADVAEVCVKGLSSPSACNVFCYVRNRLRRKQRNGQKFAPGNSSLEYKLSQLKQDL